MTAKSIVSNWDCENMCAARKGQYDKANDALLLEGYVLAFAFPRATDLEKEAIICHLKIILA